MGGASLHGLVLLDAPQRGQAWQEVQGADGLPAPPLLARVASATDCFRRATAAGGDAHLSWPKHAVGWQQRVVKFMIVSLGMELANFDGCSFGVMVSKTTLALKPWTLATTHRGLASALAGRRCTKDHDNVPFSGA